MAHHSWKLPAKSRSQSCASADSPWNPQIKAAKSLTRTLTIFIACSAGFVHISPAEALLALRRILSSQNLKINNK